MVTLKDIAAIVDGEVEGDETIQIFAPSKIEDATKGTITFLSNPKYEQFAYDTQASAILVSKEFKPLHPIRAALLKVEDVYGSLGVLLNHFEVKEHLDGISDKASISKDVTIGDKTYIGNYTDVSSGAIIGNNCQIHSQVTIGTNVKIGDHVILYPGVRIYHDCEIGSHTIIHSNTVIGGDGFGFNRDDQGVYRKIPQLGNVVIEDHVEIGSNVTIDRATMGSTKIERGVKLDNLIQIAHNVIIGEDTVIAAQTGIAGSTKVGKRCLIGGQVGIVGHIEIADDTMIQAQSGVAASNDSDNKKLYGTPALPYGNYLKSYAHFKNLPIIMNELRSLKKQIATLEQNLNSSKEEQESNDK